MSNVTCDEAVTQITVAPNIAVCVPREFKDSIQIGFTYTTSMCILAETELNQYVQCMSCCHFMACLQAEPSLILWHCLATPRMLPVAIQHIISI